MKARILKKKFLTNDLEILWLQLSEKFEFKPGQYCTVGYKGVERAYSIVSSPLEKSIELFVEIVPASLKREESLTPKLCSLDIGTEVNVRPKPKGLFTLDPHFKKQVMVATVTGIAPFMSMIRSYLKGYYPQKIEEPLYVFQGASYCDEFGYDEELREIAKSTGKILYVNTVSRPQDPRNKIWLGDVGRVNLILDTYFKKLNITPRDTVVYLCGHEAMIDDLGNKKESPGEPLGKLVRKGFEIRSEIYF
ncbi:MAG: hypothetical protein HYS98_07535 [Deltaproteobacteria bacterium]|nr:hypothetical protein [Deltaproteobacteria bacterium]